MPYAPSLRAASVCECFGAVRYVDATIYELNDWASMQVDSDEASQAIP